MIKFLLKGIFRDKSRSLLPSVVVSLGVMLTVVLTCFFTGMFGEMIVMNANFSTGHVKIMTKAYSENVGQNPNDLALLRSNEMVDSLQKVWPEMTWVLRINFGGLLDVPDENGETIEQGPMAGMAIDLFSEQSQEVQRMNIGTSIVRGVLPSKSGEALISDEFAQRLGIELGQKVTFFGSTMYGSMTFANFTIVGTISFGSAAMDRGALIVDLTDAQQALDMQNATGQILGYLANNDYDKIKTAAVVEQFNAGHKNNTSEFAPIMLGLRDQNDLASLIDISDQMAAVLIMIFIFAMSLVLWNTGLLGGLRRYKEYGIRLALGESKRQIFISIIYEAAIIGSIGSVLGIIAGLGISYYLQEVGLDFGDMMKNIGMMIPSVFKAKIVPQAYFIGFIPGLFSMVLGSALAGLGIFKRQTAQLFNELEV